MIDDIPPIVSGVLVSPNGRVQVGYFDGTRLDFDLKGVYSQAAADALADNEDFRKLFDDHYSFVQRCAAAGSFEVSLPSGVQDFHFEFSE